MTCRRVWRGVPVLAWTMIGLFPSLVQAGPVPLYTLIDLGPGIAAPTTDSAGRGVVVAPASGAEYAFDYTDHRVVAPDAIAAAESALPPGAGSLTALFVNRAGDYLVTATHSDSPPGEAFFNTDVTVYSGRVSADGTYGPGSAVWAWYTYGIPGYPGPDGEILGFSDTGRALVRGMNPEGYVRSGLPDLHLREPRWPDLAAQTELFSLFEGATNPDLARRFFGLDARYIDDQGRLLLYGETLAPVVGHTLLLVPAGLSTDPIAVPEPSALVITALGVSALAWRWRLRGAPVP